MPSTVTSTTKSAETFRIAGSPLSPVSLLSELTDSMSEICGGAGGRTARRRCGCSKLFDHNLPHDGAHLRARRRVRPSRELPHEPERGDVSCAVAADAGDATRSVLPDRRHDVGTGQELHQRVDEVIRRQPAVGTVLELGELPVSD